MLARYHPNSSQEHENALKEILHEIILLGLDRAGFFEKAAFYGGTALRIFYKLDRFSEDLDFTLLKPNKSFNFETYFSSLSQELRAFDFQFDLERVEKTEERLTESAFLKSNTHLLFLHIEPAKKLASQIQKNQKIKIKFEVDIDRPLGFKTEIKTQLLPTPFTVTVLTPASLFAGKMHAVLFRKWQKRVKGRDFYDLQWFVARNIPTEKSYLEAKIKASEELKTSLTKEYLVETFRQKSKSIDWETAAQDVLPFLYDKSQVRLWSAKFFGDLVSRIQLV